MYIIQRDEAITSDQHDISAKQMVDDFMLQLTTPNIPKPTKKIKFASKARNANTVNNKKEKENVKPKEVHKKEMPSKVRTRQRVVNPSTSGKTAGGVFKAPKPKPPANGINSKLPKTSSARPNYGGNQMRSTRNHMKSKSNSSKSSLSPSSSSQTQPPPSQTIDQYSLSLQIKNSECESLKNESKELKERIKEMEERNKALKDVEREYQFCKRDILNLNEESRNKDDRISKLERKLESCGIDPVALQSPAFMNEDTQKHIIFWRERLFKAREKLNERKLKQRQMIETAQFHIKQMSG